MALQNVVIDLSHHNTVTSFHDIASAGVLGVVHKATEGMGAPDPTYQDHRNRVGMVNLLWGAYHFNSAMTSPIDQADHFLDVAKPKPGELMVLDWEQGKGGVMSRAQAEAFVQRIKDQTGRFPTVYAGSSFINSTMKNVSASDTVLSKCPLWIARYGPQPIAPPAWSTFSLWQYTDGAVGRKPHGVNGVGNCDRDMFNDAVGTLQQFWAR